MSKKKSPNYFINPNFKNYLRVIYLSLSSPSQFLGFIPKHSSLKQALTFFSLNIALGFIIHSLIKVLETKTYSLLYLEVGSTPFILIFSYFCLAFITVFIHTLAKILGGKASLLDTLKVICYSSIYDLFLLIPFLWVPVLLWQLYSLAKLLKKVQRYSSFKVIINLSIPFLFVILVLSFFGFKTW